MIERLIVLTLPDTLTLVGSKVYFHNLYPKELCCVAGGKTRSTAIRSVIRLMDSVLLALVASKLSPARLGKKRIARVVRKGKMTDLIKYIMLFGILPDILLFETGSNRKVT